MPALHPADGNFQSVHIRVAGQRGHLGLAIKIRGPAVDVNNGHCGDIEMEIRVRPELTVHIINNLFKDLGRIKSGGDAPEIVGAEEKRPVNKDNASGQDDQGDHYLDEGKAFIAASW